MYDYKNFKNITFTDEGQRTFLLVRDRARHILNTAGAFKTLAPTKGICGDGWVLMAYLDRLVELGEIREITNSTVAGQDRVFVSSGL